MLPFINKRLPSERAIAAAWDTPVLVQCIQAHNEERMIQAVMGSIYDEVDRILVLEGATVSRPNRTPDGHSVDGTVAQIEDFIKNHDPENKVTLIQRGRPFVDLEEMKNTFLHYINDKEWVIINDADEFYLPEDIRRIRELTYIYDDAIEFVPMFLHFYRDTKHIVKPDEENQPQHQRIFRYRDSMHYRSHPVIAYSNGMCSYFTEGLQVLRYIIPDMYIWHLGFVKNEEEVRAKAVFYEKELEKHGDSGVAAHNEKTEAFLNRTEKLDRIAEYNGVLPPAMVDLNIPDDETYKGLSFDNWKLSEPYCLERPPNCWVMTKTGQWNDYSNTVIQ
jgi:hypothetical protein